MQGIIPEFGDIELAYTVDGKSSPDSFPTKESGYIATGVKCNEGVEASWNNITWTLSDIKVENKKRIICTVNFSKDTSEATLAEKAKLGDYVEMTPTATSFTIPGSLTGCAEEGSNCTGSSENGDQTIEPSELTTWRIIDIKEDGTIEMISENISSNKICFRGSTGYKNIVGTLNLIASSYENSGYTICSKYFGFTGQTEFVVNDLTNSKPLEESLGGGNAFPTISKYLKSYIVNTSNYANYWVSGCRVYLENTNFLGPRLTLVIVQKMEKIKKEIRFMS